LRALVLSGLIVSVSTLVANATVPVSLSGEAGAFTLVGAGLEVSVTEGSQIGMGVRIGDSCRTVGPIAVGYRFDSSTTAATVTWSFNEECEAIVTSITTTSSGPAFEGVGGEQICRAMYCLLPHGVQQDLVENRYEMFARSTILAPGEQEVSSAEATAQYVIRTLDDGTQEIEGINYWNSCHVPDSQPTVTNKGCGGGPGDGQEVGPQDGSLEDRFGADVIGEFTYQDVVTRLRATTYTQTAEIWDVAGPEPGAPLCRVDGLFPIGFDDPCTGQARIEI
ncbi:MAG: hypothetical protein ACRDH9_10860, partial [Actinomycetota bacterium]